MDTCFGLARRKRPGQTCDMTPKHGELLFADQSDVDNFVNAHSQKAEDIKEVQCDICCEVVHPELNKL